MKKNKMNEMDRFNKKFEVLRFLMALLIAFAISFIIMFFFTDKPLSAIVNLFIGPLTSVRRFSTVLEKMIPLTFAGLAVSIMFKANQFNLAAEGGMYLGALIAAIIAIFMPGPPIVVVITCLMAGGLVGAVVCFIPGILKVTWNVSELVVSLMLNSVVLFFGTFIFNKVARDQNSAYAASYTFKEGVNLSQLVKNTRLHSGIFIVAIFVIFTYLFIYKTKWGYKLRITGSNIKFAKSSGIKTTAVILSSQLIGGFIAGVGGSTEMIGMYTRFQWMSLPGYGFDGVIINILAKGNPLLIPIASFFISYLRIGADYMYRQSDIASEIVAIIEGLIIMFVAATAFLSTWKHKMTTKVSKRQMEDKMLVSEEVK